MKVKKNRNEINDITTEKKNKDEQEDKEKNKSCNRKEEYSLLFQERKIKEVEMIKESFSWKDQE